MTRLRSFESKTSLTLLATTIVVEQKKILLKDGGAISHITDVMTKESYKHWLSLQEVDKLILGTYVAMSSFKRHRDDGIKTEEGTLPAVHGPVQPWLSNLTLEEGPRESFNELMDTPLEFSAFMMNRLKIDTLTPDFGGQQYPYDLRKPLPLIPNSHGRQVIPFDQFMNNDLAYLSGGVSSRTYTTSVIKTMLADYGHIKWIEDLVPNTIWSEVPVNYDKHALWGISHWGRKRQQFYGFAANRESAHDVYSKRRIIDVTKLQNEGDFKRLRLQDIEDMLILLVQGKLINLNVEDRLAFGVTLRMFTRSIVIQRRVEDLQLGVESYQKKLNITKLDTYRSDLRRRDAYTAYSNLRGFIYQNKDKKNKLMRIDELHKFSDGIVDDVRTALNDRLKGIRMAMTNRLKSRRIMRSLEKFVSGRPYEGDLRLLQRTYDVYRYDVSS
ncbi:hypothetical protein Tco_1327407 [Tanacetum coccineum]